MKNLFGEDIKVSAPEKEPEKIPKKSPFDFLNSINGGPRGEDLLLECRGQGDECKLESVEKQYLPFMVNRGLSYHEDTVLLCNEMNRLYRLPNLLQYDFLRFTVRPRKRFGKWHKMEKEEYAPYLVEVYGYSYRRAVEAASLLSSDELETIKNACSRGGIDK